MVYFCGLNDVVTAEHDRDNWSAWIGRQATAEGSSPHVKWTCTARRTTDQTEPQQPSMIHSSDPRQTSVIHGRCQFFAADVSDPHETSIIHNNL